MKSSFKGLIGLTLIFLLSTTTYYFWKERKLKEIEVQRSLNIKPWNKLDWNKWVILGLWSNKQLKLIESSGTYFLTVSNKKNPLYLKTQNRNHRYSSKEIIDCLNKNRFLDSLAYLGDKTTIKKIQKVENKSYLLEINDTLRQNLWWLYEKDPKSKVLFLFDKEIIGTFHLKGGLVTNQIKLTNVDHYIKFD